MEYDNKRTLTQNAAMHAWFQMYADELNAGGQTVSVVLDRAAIDSHWSGHLFKELVVKKLLMKEFGKDSTTKMTTQELDRLYDQITLFMGQNFDVFIPFPSKETLHEHENLRPARQAEKEPRG